MTVHLLPGQFYGVRHERVRGGLFDLGLMEARAPEHDVHLHLHEEAHFVLVLAGTYLSSARGAPQQAPAPALVYNPPRTVHRDRFLGGRGRFMTVSIDPLHLDGWEGGHAGMFNARFLAQPACLRGAFSLVRAMQGGPDGALLESGVWELLGDTATDACAPPRQPPAWLRKAYEAVMDGPGDSDLSIARLAADAGVHPVHLARVFRTLLGCSPGELLRWRRIERACAMLRDAHRGLAEVALAAGFVDQSHLTHAFRQRFGIPPGAWRRRAAGERMFDGYKTVAGDPD